MAHSSSRVRHTRSPLVIGDYVQLRNTETRGEVAQVYSDGWVLVYETYPARRRLGIDHEFFKEHERNLIRLIGKEQLGDV